MNWGASTFCVCASRCSSTCIITLNDKHKTVCTLFLSSALILCFILKVVTKQIQDVHVKFYCALIFIWTTIQIPLKYITCAVKVKIHILACKDCLKLQSGNHLCTAESHTHHQYSNVIFYLPGLGIFIHCPFGTPDGPQSRINMSAQLKNSRQNKHTDIQPGI